MRARSFVSFQTGATSLFTFCCWLLPLPLFSFSSSVVEAREREGGREGGGLVRFAWLLPQPLFSFSSSVGEAREREEGREGGVDRGKE